MFFLPTSINLGTIKFSNPDVLSTFTIGQACLTNICNVTKKNQGYGQQNADLSTISLPINFVNDDDFNDSSDYSIVVSQLE